MAKRRKILENIEVTDTSSNGKGVGRFEDIVIFIDKVVPGDIVDVQVTRKKSSFYEGIPVSFKKESPLRIDAFCDHFGVCGGCKWQNLSYENQKKFKQKQVTDALTKIGKVEPKEVLPFVGAENTQYYRNKLEYTFSNNKWLTDDEIKSKEQIDERNALGFHIPKRFDKILDIQHCYLQDTPSNEIRNTVRKFAIENEISFYDIKKQEGYLRNLIIRTSTTGDLMIIVITKGEITNDLKKLFELLINDFPQITSLIHMNNSKKNDAIYDLDFEVISGKDHIIEKLDNYKFKIGPKSFFQTNSKQALNLYNITKDFADINENDLVLDLYTGAGSIAIYISEKAKKVIGIETVASAIENAKENATLNNIDNVDFHVGVIEKFFDDDFININGKPDIVITDPPRAGMHKNVIEQLLKVEPKKIVYVSCNPATQARDIELLSEKYVVTKSQAVDMFPHTSHVENVVLLVNSKNES